MRTLSAKFIAVHVGFLAVALLSIGVTLLVSWELEGGAAAINDAGSLRMRAYRLAYVLADYAPPSHLGRPLLLLVRHRRTCAAFPSLGPGRAHLNLRNSV